MPESTGSRASSARDATPSLLKTLRRWKSMVPVLRNSCAATSRVGKPSSDELGDLQFLWDEDGCTR